MSDDDKALLRQMAKEGADAAAKGIDLGDAWTARFAALAKRVADARTAAAAERKARR